MRHHIREQLRSPTSPSLEPTVYLVLPNWEI